MAAIIDVDVIANWADLLTHQNFNDKEDAGKFLKLFLVELGVITPEEEKKLRPCCD